MSQICAAHLMLIFFKSNLKKKQESKAVGTEISLPRVSQNYYTIIITNDFFIKDILLNNFANMLHESENLRQ